jgi:hypothetical protein
LLSSTHCCSCPFFPPQYFSGLCDGERSYLTMRSSPKHGGELSCQSEPGNTYSTVGLEFLPRLKATGRTGTFGPFYNTTPAAEFVSNEGTCWVSIVPFFECIVTAWIPLDPVGGLVWGVFVLVC